MKNRFCLPIIRRFSTLTALAALAGMWLTSTAAAQVPQLLLFADTPCDSTRCMDTLIFRNMGATPVTIQDARLLDGTAYSLAGAPVFPMVIPDSTLPFRLTICLRPGRRGGVSDSLRVIKTAGALTDTSYVILSGKGVGPDIVATPSILNLPKTAVNGTVTGSITIVNNGERPFSLTPLPASLTLAAPFTITNLASLPPAILPGDSIVLQIRFSPTANGVFSTNALLNTVCNTSVQMSINGYTDLTGTGAIIRVTKSTFNPATPERIGCDSIKCVDVTIQNVGSAPLIVDSLRLLGIGTGYSIATTTTLPLLVPPTETRTLTICLRLTGKSGSIIDTLHIISNTRNSIAFGIVLDESGSMRDVMNCGTGSTTKIAEAIVQAQSFVDKTLLDLRNVGVQDEVVITAYTTISNFNTNPRIRTLVALTPVTNAVKATARTQIGTIAPTNGTPTGGALRDMIDKVSLSALADKVIILLTDGVATDQTGNTTAANVIAYAKSKGVKIFAIGLFTTANDRTQGLPYLNNICTQTGGVSFDASDCGSLQKAFETITDILSRNTRTREPFAAIKISAPLLTFPALTFDSTAVGDSTCKKLTISNSGDDDAIISQMQLQDLIGGPTSDFVIGQAINYPLFITRRGGKVDLNVCFKPRAIRQRQGQARLNYNSCDGAPKLALLTGVGFTALPLRVNDQRVGLPGALVSMPIYCDSSLRLYSVDTITYQVRWNKSMLDLQSVTPLGGTWLVGAPTVQFDQRYAIATVKVVGNTIAGGSPIGDFHFRVLRGDTLATLVELVSGRFQDNNPRAYLINAGLIAYDSTCFRDYKGVKNLLGGKVAVGQFTPTPSSNGTVTLPVTSDAPAQITLEVFAVNGAISKSLGAHTLKAGLNTLPVSLSDLPDGSYYCVIRSQTGDTFFRKLLLVR